MGYRIPVLRGFLYIKPDRIFVSPHEGLEVELPLDGYNCIVEGGENLRRLGSCCENLSFHSWYSEWNLDAQEIYFDADCVFVIEEVFNAFYDVDTSRFVSTDDIDYEPTADEARLAMLVLDYDAFPDSAAEANDWLLLTSDLVSLDTECEAEQVDWVKEGF